MQPFEGKYGVQNAWESVVGSGDFFKKRGPGSQLKIIPNGFRFFCCKTRSDLRIVISDPRNIHSRLEFALYCPPISPNKPLYVFR